jgi:hypothetical protein
VDEQLSEIREINENNATESDDGSTSEESLNCNYFFLNPNFSKLNLR